jgi:alcohol dehydrogenase
MPVQLSTQMLDIAPLPRLVFGVGAIEQLGSIAKSYGGRCLLVTDPGVTAAGVAAIVRAALASEVEVAVFDQVHANPVLDDISGGAAAYRDAFGDAPGVVVGLGGGSSMDAAKGIALLLTNPRHPRDLDYRKPLEYDGLPLIAVPTTAGTGAETNAFGVITDHELNNKLYVGNGSVLPKVALLDPALTVGVPKVATANTGMDAITHAIEAIGGKGRNAYAEGLCLEVASMVQCWLPAAVDDGGDLEARSQLLLAAHLAGVAMATGTGQGAAHGIGHALSTRLGVAHGAGLAVVLPPVMRFSAPVVAEKYARLAVALGVADVAKGEEYNADAAIDAVFALSARVGTARRLDDFGMTDELVGVIAQDCLDDVVTNNAPRYPTVDEVASIIASAR